MMRTWSGLSFSCAGLCCTQNADRKASATFVFFKIAPHGWRTNHTGRHGALLSLRSHGRVRHVSPAGTHAVNSASQRLPAAHLKRFTADALLAVGLPAKDATACAELMARADLQGAAGHGIFRLPQYVRRIKGREVNVKPQVKTAVQRGETLPEGWMIDHQGRPLTDPKRADQGLLVPIGGYKGYGLALVFGLLAGTLNGAAMGSETVDFNADDVTPTNTGHAIVAISIAAFGEVDEFKRRVDKLAREIRRSKPMPGVARIWLPGEQSRAKFEERSKLGIPIPEPLRAGLDELARELKIEALAP